MKSRTPPTQVKKQHSRDGRFRNPDYRATILRWFENGQIYCGCYFLSHKLQLKRVRLKVGSWVFYTLEIVVLFREIFCEIKKYSNGR